MTDNTQEQSAKNAHCTKQELREKVRSIFQSETKNLWRSPDYDEFPVPNYEDDIVQLLTDTVNKVLKHQEVVLRHDIAGLAPPCEHKLGDKDHKPYCGFINAIWQHWAIKNGSDYRESLSAIEQVRKEWSDGE